MVPKSNRLPKRTQKARLNGIRRFFQSGLDDALLSGLILPAEPLNGNTALFGVPACQPLAAHSKYKPARGAADEAFFVDGALTGGSGVPGSYEILVAEDHPINLKLLLALLQAAGCRSRCAGNGLEALAELEKAEFDLIVMDSRMPVMTGLEAIAIIRRRTDWKRFIPILSLTAHAMKGAEEYHTSVGADLYMSKPLQSDCFFRAVKSLAQRGRELRTKNGSGGAGSLVERI